MKIEALLERLEVVRHVGRGWRARCPAHRPDRTPSLTIREGEKGLLVRCWAGCTVEEVMAALGLGMADLFYDADLSPHKRRRSRNQPKPRCFDWRRYAGELEDEALSLWLRAQSVLAAALALPLNNWTDDDIEVGLEAVTRAHVDLARAACLETIAVNVRACGLRKEQERERTRRAA